jgi:hypothetical protein
MNIREGPVGTWAMVGPLDEPYALIALVRRGGELGYRVTNAHGSVIGYYRTLMAASKAAHSWFTSTRGPTGVPFVAWTGAEQR